MTLVAVGRLLFGTLAVVRVDVEISRLRRFLRGGRLVRVRGRRDYLRQFIFD